jgi:hypothetical protein
MSRLCEFLFAQSCPYPRVFANPLHSQRRRRPLWPAAGASTQQVRRRSSRHTRPSNRRCRRHHVFGFKIHARNASHSREQTLFESDCILFLSVVVITSQRHRHHHSTRHLVYRRQMS